MFVLLCFCVLFCALLVILSLLLVIMGGQHDGLFLSGSPPILYIYIHMYIFSWQINSAAAAATETAEPEKASSMISPINHGIDRSTNEITSVHYTPRRVASDAHESDWFPPSFSSRSDVTASAMPREILTSKFKRCSITERQLCCCHIHPPLIYLRKKKMTIRNPLIHYKE